MIDTVVVVPGIMGSRLVDHKDDAVWGVPRIAALKIAGMGIGEKWAAGRLADLELTEAERAGRQFRFRPSGLVKEPVWSPRFRMNFGYKLLTSGCAKWFSIRMRCSSSRTTGAFLS